VGIKYASLFSGIGGFEKGINQASEIVEVNAECVFASEIDKFAQQTYTKHFGSDYLHGDITKIEGESVPDIDMRVGGFPCQAFSIAGKRRGFDDCRGTLFFDIARIMQSKRPKVVLLENVKGLLNHDKGNTFRTILSTLDELGYDAEWQVLNSKNYGVPHNRERVFIVGHLRGERGSQIFPLGEADSLHPKSRTDQEKVREIASTLMAKSYSSWVGNYVIHSLYPRSSKSGNGGTSQLSKSNGTTYCLGTKTNQAIEIKPRCNLDSKFKDVTGRTVKEDGEPSYTVTTRPNRIGVQLESQIRKFTPIECERLQGFPDGWTEGVSNTQRYKQIGNSVTVNVIEAVMIKILSIYGE